MDVIPVAGRERERPATFSISFPDFHSHTHTAERHQIPQGRCSFLPFTKITETYRDRGLVLPIDYYLGGWKVRDGHAESGNEVTCRYQAVLGCATRTLCSKAHHSYTDK